MKTRVLVLDDDIAVLEAIDAALSYEGYQVMTVGRTYNIFKTIEEFHPDLLLVDVVLDGINGADICRQVKNKPGTRGLPIIVISGLCGNSEKLERLECDHFLAKPFDLAELSQSIEKVLSNSNMRLPIRN